MPMLARSAAEKRDRTRLLRSMKVWSREAPVQGLRGSFLDARRPFDHVISQGVVLTKRHGG